MTANGNLLEVSGLNVAYGELKVLFDVGITVKPGQVVACVGRNGAGKSTLLKTIAGFISLPRHRHVEGANRVGPCRLCRGRMGTQIHPAGQKGVFRLDRAGNLELGSTPAKITRRTG